MSAVDLSAGNVMDAAASLMNDTAQTVYNYAAQVPYINMALKELREVYELNSIPAAQNVSAVIQMDTGETEIIYNAIGSPALPDDFVEPVTLWERPRDVDPFVPMTRKSFLPREMQGVETSQFIYYVWQDQKIKVLPANQDNDIKIDYIKELFAVVTDENSPINVVNAASFLQFRTAGLMAEFIERNITSANALNAQAMLAIDRALGVGIRSKQSIFTRRRPFRSGYKHRGWVT